MYYNYIYYNIYVYNYIHTKHCMQMRCCKVIILTGKNIGIILSDDIVTRVMKEQN